MEQYDAEVLEVPTDPSWHITGSQLEGFDAPVYRFIPGITRSEGLFICALRKNGECRVENVEFATAIPSPNRTATANSTLYTLNSKLKILTPDLPQGDFPRIPLSYSDALKYLRGEALVLPEDTPRGIVTVCYKNIPLGPMKNIGNRANNLYPKGWRIKTTHLPTEEIKIINI